VEPVIQVNPGYNPFDQPAPPDSRPPQPSGYAKPGDVTGWEQLYAGLENTNVSPSEIQPPDSPSFLQFKNRYILIPVKSGIMVVHQARALERILYEEFRSSQGETAGEGQQLLYPVTFELNPGDISLLTGIREELASIGFDIQPFGGQSVILRAVPASSGIADPKELIGTLLEELRNETPDISQLLKDSVIQKVARLSARSFTRLLKDEEVRALIDRLFACREPQFTPGGKPVLTIMKTEEIEKRLG